MPNLKVYKASAGSGKTYTLALEYIKELLAKNNSHSHRHILAVTFTKDATGEMKDRILSELYGLAFDSKDSAVFMESVRAALENAGKPMNREQIQDKARKILKEILHDYSRLYITTIDSFFQKVLRNLARELGKGSKFNLEMNSFKVLSDAVSAMIENANQNQQLLDWLTTYIEDRLDEGTNWRIDKEILNFSRCIFDEYFQEHEYNLKRQLEDDPKIFGKLWNSHTVIQKECKDFFKKAYNEVNKIIEQRSLDLSDFSRNGTVINFLGKLAEGDFYNAKPEGKTIQDCTANADKWAASKSKRKDEITTLAEINFMPLLNQVLDILRKFNTSRMITKNIHQLGLIWDITNEITQQNAENNRFMLADTALFLNRMIDDSDASFIYEKIGAEIEHVMIDEFQDTSRLQWKNFKALLSNIIAANRFSLIVGDVKQSIYRWRNGDWSILNNIGRELSVDNRALSFNYRSEREIIDFNNRFFTHAASLLNEKFFSLFEDTSLSPFLSTYDPADVVQLSRKAEVHGYVSVDYIPDKTEDAKYNDLVLAELLNKIIKLEEKGVPPEQICILTRTNRNIVGVAEFLSTQKDIYSELREKNYLNVVSNEAFQLNSSPAIRIIIEALRVLAEPDNPVPKAQLQIYLDKMIYQSSDDLDRIFMEKSIDISELAQPDELAKRPLFELTGHIFRIFHLEQLEGQSNYMFSFYDALNNYLKDFPADIHAFLKFWTDELQFKSVPSGTAIEGIRAMTIHKSKGLQFHTVIIPFCDWDLYPEKNPIVWCGPKNGLYDLELLPVKYNHKMYDTVFLDEYERETGQAWMDNINILYVAFTRAEQNLIVLAKNKKKLASHEDIKTVSDLLQYSMSELKGYYVDDDELFFEKGVLDQYVQKEEKKTDNLLKQQPVPLHISFVSETFSPDKSIFKQSNKSRDFIKGDNRSGYIDHGNVMHTLFSYIQTEDDIDKAVDHLLFGGLISQEERENYIRQVKSAIDESGRKDWFSTKYRIYNECDIILQENGEVTNKRPDRVLFGDNETIIIDYKFGEPHKSHERQMQQYMHLMQEMKYKNIKSYIWYMKTNTIKEVKT